MKRRPLGLGAAVANARATRAPRDVRACVYCNEPDIPGHDLVCEEHPDPCAQAEGHMYPEGFEP